MQMAGNVGTRAQTVTHTDASPKVAPPSALRRSAAPVVIGALPFLVLTVVTIAQAHQASNVSGDLAAMELRTRAAAHFRELLGPYSRFGWDHPGPIAFYWAVPFYLLSGQRPGGLAAASAAANLGWVIAVIAAARRAGGVAAGWLAAATALGLAAVLGTPWLRFAWNPFQVILPVAAVGILGAATWAGVRWALPGAALAATWAVQTHVGTTPVVVALSIGTLIPAAWTQRHRWREWSVAIIAASAGTVVLWIPPLVDWVHRPPGNLRLLTHFFLGSHAPPHGLGEVMRVVAPQLSLSSQHLGSHLATDTAHFRPLGVTEGVVLAALLAVLVVGAWRGARVGATFQLGCSVAGILGSVAAVVATRSAPGELLPYFTSFATGVGVVVWLAVLLTVSEGAATVWHRAASEAGGTGVAIPRLAEAGGAALLIVAIVLSTDAIHARSFSTISDHPDIGRLVAGSRRALGPASQRPVLVVVGENHPWPQAAGLAAALERQGITVHTTDPWVFLFGYYYRPRLDEAQGLLVLGSQAGAFPQPPPGASLVAQADAAQVWKLPAIAAAKAGASP